MYVKNGITVLSGLTLIQNKKGGQESSPLAPFDQMNIEFKHFGYVDFSKLWVRPEV